MNEVQYLMLGVVGVVLLVAGARIAFKRRRGRGGKEPADPALAARPEGQPEGSAFAYQPPEPSAFQTRLEGDLKIGGHSAFPGGVVLNGSLVLEASSVLEGAAEVQGNVSLGANARLTDPLVVRGNLVLGPEAVVGASRVDGSVTLYPGARVEGALECNELLLIEGPVPKADGEAAAPLSVAVQPTA